MSFDSTKLLTFCILVYQTPIYSGSYLHQLKAQLAETGA